MSKWNEREVGDIINFNPRESIKVGTLAKKIPMEKLTTFTKKIKGFEIMPFQAGPKFRNGDTLLAKITPCLENGKTAFVDILEENEVSFGSSEFIVLRENELSDKHFIYYLAISPIFRKKAISCMEGTSGRKRVNDKVLKEQVINVPDLATQRSIATVLSTLDAKIELNNRINTELEAMAKTLYDYWFVQFDFPSSLPSLQRRETNTVEKPYKSSGGKMVWNEELKRDVPDGWAVGNLSDIANIIGGSTPPREIPDYFSKDGTAWITPKDLSLNTGNKFITKGEIDVSSKGLKAASLNIMPKGTILLSSRAPIGYMAISRTEVTTNQGFKSFVPKENYTIPYIFYTVKNLIPTIENKAVGSTFREISALTLKTIEIHLPEKSIIEKYTEIVNPIFEKQNKIELENQQLSTLRDWLLPMLMNGQVEVV
jgi:type I restriction enzyme, S subunit